MSFEPGPSIDDEPLASAADAPPRAPAGIPTGETPAETPPPIARPSLPPLDPRSQLAAGAGLAVAVIALLGSVLGAWDFTFTGLILIVAGLAAAGAAYVSATQDPAPSLPIALRDIILSGAVISAILGILFVAEILADLDDIEGYGGVLGLTATILLGIAGVTLYIAATQWWTGGPAAPWMPAIARGGRPTRLVLGGAALVVIGWLGNVTVGFWFLEPGVEVITFVLLAALVMRAASDPDEPLVLPFPAAIVAAVLAGLGAIIALQHTQRLLAESSAGLDSWLFQALYVAGVALALVGAILGAVEAIRPASADTAGETPTT